MNTFKKCILLILLSTTISKAEINIKIYYEQSENGYYIYADNQEFCPVSIKINFTTTNLNINGGNNKVYVVNSQTKKQLLTSLSVTEHGKPYKFSYQTTFNYGDYYNTTYDENFIYDLPFKKSEKFSVLQGYNGTFSHQNENSLDFSMPIGTELFAIREGIVIKVIDNNNRNCATKDCAKYNNTIIIYHSDGTFAEYTHLKQKGAIVKVGDQITKGQIIGYSGNVGWSSVAHLHLVIFKQGLENRETLKTKFKIENGDKNEFLIEKKEYSKIY
ncbi:M23 family metallopeptidase [Flavobacterium sp.]